MFFLPPFELSVLQYHVFRNDEVLKYNGFIIDLHRLCHIPVDCRNTRLPDWLSDRETFVTSFPFIDKSLFCTDKLVTVEWPNLAQYPRTGDCCATHTPRGELSGQLLSSHQHFRRVECDIRCVFCKAHS